MPNWCSNTVTIQGSADKMRKLFAVIDAMTDDDCLFASTVGKKDSYGDDWYNHNIDEYGTKWDVDKSNFHIRDRNLADNIGGDISIGMETAWSPPTKWCRKLSKKYGVVVTIIYSESGCNFYGENTYDNGEKTHAYSASYLEGMYTMDEQCFWDEVAEYRLPSCAESGVDIDEVLKEFSFVTQEDRNEIINIYKQLTNEKA